MADEDVVAEEIIAEAPAEEKPAEAVQDELPLEATEEKPAETAEVKPEEKPAEIIEEPKPDWKDRELKKKHAQIMEARRVLAEKDAELERLRAGQPVDTNAIQPQQVEARARQIVDEQRYLESCNAANESGQKTYGAAWKSAVETLEQLGGFDIPTMRGIMATGAADKALYQLGKNPDEYHRIMDLPLERRIVEITKLTERAQVTPKQVSQAPAPVRTVGGTASVPADQIYNSEKSSDDEWYRAAQARRAKKFAAQGRR